MWKTYPQRLWKTYIAMICCMRYVENLSTGNVDKMYRGDRYVDNVENLSTTLVENLYHDDILHEMCGKLIHITCG